MILATKLYYTVLISELNRFGLHDASQLAVGILFMFETPRLFLGHDDPTWEWRYPNDTATRYTLFKLFGLGLPFTLSHRNAGILSSLGMPHCQRGFRVTEGHKTRKNRCYGSSSGGCWRWARARGRQLGGVCSKLRFMRRNSTRKFWMLSGLE